MKLIFLSVILVFALTSVHGQKQDSFSDEMEYRGSSGDGGYAKLTSEKSQFAQGERHSVSYTFHNTSGSYWIYNFSFNPLLPKPGKLAIYDADKKYIGDLVAWEMGSRRSAGDGDFTFLYGGGHAGSRIGFKAGYVPFTKYGFAGNDLLPAGRYFLQLILYRAFFSVNPRNIVGEKAEFYKTFDKSEAVRSNVIEIEIVES